MTTLAHAFANAKSPIAHIKSLVTTVQGNLKASLTQSDTPITWDLQTDVGQSERLQFILNVRVHAAPPLLEQIVVQSIEKIKPDPGSRYYFEHFECFSPLPPKPSHRLLYLHR